MYSVFSQNIVDCWKRDYRGKDMSIENIIQEVRKQTDMNRPSCITIFPQVLWCHEISVLSYLKEEASKELWINRDLLKVLHWIENNIVLQIDNDFNRKTLMVKLRIAVDMLNKLEYSGKISKEVNLFFYDNVITNCNDLWFDVHFEPLEELPF